MSNKEELLEEIGKIKELLKDRNKFMHLFSDDEAERTLAELYKLVGRVEILTNLSTIKDIDFPTNKALNNTTSRGLVMIRPVAAEYQNKTFLGFHIGDVALSTSVGITDDKIHCNFSSYNPAIYVPELKKVIYGIESWWGNIKSEEDFKKITNQDIDNVWYVKMWKQMNKKNHE